MDDIFGKIGELLSDEESVKQLSELAHIFMNEASGENNSTENTQDDNEENRTNEENDSASSGGFDFSSLMKLQGLMSAFNQKDKNTELLLALKPHLNEEKSEKVDKAIKLMKVIALWNVIKDSGLLKDFL